MPAAVVGSVILGLSIAAPAAADTEPTPTTQPGGPVFTTLTPGPSAEPTFVDLGPGATTSPTSQPTATSTAQPTADPTDQPGLPDVDGDYLTGEFSITPGSGPAGTTVTATSVDACEQTDGVKGESVDTFLFSEADLDSDDDTFTDVATAATKADGSWTTKLKIPSDAADDSLYVLVTVCYAQAADQLDEDSEPFQIYEGQPFLVTDAPAAAPAKPVAGTPAYTG